MSGKAKEEIRMACSVVKSREHRMRKDFIQNNNSAKMLRRMSRMAWLNDGKREPLLVYRDELKRVMGPKRDRYMEDQKRDNPNELL